MMVCSGQSEVNNQEEPAYQYYPLICANSIEPKSSLFLKIIWILQLFGLGLLNILIIIQYFN